MRKPLFIVLFSILAIFSNAQTDEAAKSKYTNTSKLYIGFETGYIAMASSLPDMDFIRKDPIYYSGYHTDYSTISSVVNLGVFAAKAEYRLLKDKLWLSTGVNYSMVNTTVGKLYYTNGDEYFYIRTNSSDENAYYFKVKSIKEKNNYVGIPVDIRYSPFKSRFIRMYFKVGFDFRFLLSSNQSIDFVNSEMDKYEEDVKELFNSSSNFLSIANLGAGMQFGKADKINFRIEGCLPAFSFTPQSLGLVDLTVGGGAQFSIVLPLKSK